MEFNRPTNIIPAPWAENGQYETIPATQVSSGRASWDTGFPPENTIPVSSGGIPANYNDFQGVLHDLSEHTCFQQTGGLYAWTSSIDYPVGAIVQGGDAKTYQAVAKNGPNTSVVNPTTDSSGSYWNTFVMAGGSQTINGAKTFTSSAVFSGGITVSGTISGTATSATSAGSATNASSLGGVAASGYVTTSGAQTISGEKTFSSGIKFALGDAISRNADTSELRVHGGTALNDGGSLIAYGKNNTVLPGAFNFRAHDGTNYKDLRGLPNGTLTWDGKGFVYDSGDQTIAGDKTFSKSSWWTVVNQGPTVQETASSPKFSLRMMATASNVGFYDSKNATWFLRKSEYNNVTLSTGSKDLYLGDNGTATWNGQTIQTSSDERLKTAFSSVPDDILDAWGKVNWQQFKYRDAVAEKGEENCRWHTGLVAQYVQHSFEIEGQDALAYGILCHDEWQDEYETDDDGKKVLTRHAGEQWYVRYTEALCMEAAYQRRRADKAEARITALEQRLGELEAVLASLISPVNDEQTIEPKQEGEGVDA